MAQCFYSTCLSLPYRHPRVPNSSFYSSQLDSSIPRGGIFTKQTLVVRPGIEKAGARTTTGAGTRVFLVSDLHTDYSENMCWVKSLSCQTHKKDVIVVAGDVAETYANFVLTMSLLKDKFQHVLFVPGNHDLWLRREKFDCQTLVLPLEVYQAPQVPRVGVDSEGYYIIKLKSFLNSLDKLNKLLSACHKLGVETKPRIVDGIGLIPLYSWYHESFDEEKDITGIRIPSLEMACKDFHVCRWPDELKNEETSLALYFDSLNDENWNIVEEILRRCSHIISFSHFVPRQELCPEKRMLFYPNLPKIIGSKYLETRVRAIHGAEGRPSACHVFGHTHFCWDAILDGVRYVQAPLAYPRERKRRMNGGEDWLPFCIYSSGNFAERLSPCYWSDYYSVNPRTPDITQLAPWVARVYTKV